MHARGRLAQIAIVLILLVNPFFCAYSAEPAELTFVDGTSFVHKREAEFVSWKDYTCVTELHNFKSNKHTITQSRFFYKKGSGVRIEFLGGGFRDGAVILRYRDEKIVGRGGFWMGGVHMNFEPNSRMLILPDGTNVTRADFPEVFSTLEDNLTHGFTCKVTSEPFYDNEFGRKVLLLELFDPERILTAKLYFSGDEKLPLRWDSYKGGKLAATSWFSDLKIDVGFEECLFQNFGKNPAKSSQKRTAGRSTIPGPLKHATE